jgi:ATP-dependent DNA helicase DinG
MFNSLLESLIEHTECVLGENGALSKVMEGFEFRNEQVFMAKAICHSLAYREHLICEAGTGIGKSLAYLVPIVFWTQFEKKRVLITTNTKTLQEQILKKDIPFLRDKCGLDFKAQLAVGSANYLCLRRFNAEITSTVTLFSPNDFQDLQEIRRWVEHTKSGLFAELPFIPSGNLQSHISRERDLCPGRKCQHYKECFYFKARNSLKEANIVVANHHLFFANLSTDGNVLPEYDAVVFDEGHNIEEVAINYLGSQFSNTGLRWLLNTIYNSKTGKGIVAKSRLSNDEIGKIKSQIEECENCSDQFFQDILSKFGNTSFKQRITEKYFIENYLSAPLMKLGDILKGLKKQAGNEESEFEFNAFAEKCVVNAKNVNDFLEQGLEDWVYWIESEKRMRFTRITLNINPIIVADLLKKMVFDKTKPCIFTSATLAINRKYDYLKDSIGLNDAVEILLDSPFDYKNNVLFYTNSEAPDPNSNEYIDYCDDMVKKIIQKTEGKAFILSTSYKLINLLSERLGESFSGYKILKQGGAPRHKLLEDFRTDKHSVLLGADTFWEGVDVQGEALECVIITRLPFEVPDEPTVQAKTEYLEKIGKNAFTDYQLPRAVLMLKQGFGRLIRSKKDIGVVAILDPRIQTRRYGVIFLNSLPKCRNIDSVEKVDVMLKEIRERLLIK